MQNNRSVGTIKEDLAADYLKKDGHEILGKNFRCKYGEIDLISKEGNYYVFTEVKYRKNAADGYPQEAVTKKKQRTIALVANYYIMKNHLTADTPVRFDVIAILGDEIAHIKNAFYAI